jgi:hypothetical protein
VAERAGLLFAGLAELAVWRRDLDQAKQLVAQAVPQVAANPRYAASIYALGLRVEADRAELARPATPASRPPTTAPPPRCCGGSTRPLRAQRPPACRSWPPGRPPPAPSAPDAIARPTRRPGRPRSPPGSGWPALPVAYAGFRHAEALLATTGDRDTAAAVLGRAAEVTGRLGARLLGGEIQALARRARLDLTPPAGATVPAAGAAAPAAQLGLTPREVEVLALVAAGRSDRQIAQALFISPKTVGVHVSNRHCCVW